jgi:hypothetical protein
VIVILDAHDVVFAEIAAGLYLDQLKVRSCRDFRGDAGRRLARRVDSFSCRKVTLSLIVARAVPRTTTQCSAR